MKEEKDKEIKIHEENPEEGKPSQQQTRGWGREGGAWGLQRGALGACTVATGNLRTEEAESPWPRRQRMVQKNFFSRKGFSDAGTGMMRGSSRICASQYARRSAAACETFTLSMHASIFSCSTAFLAWEMLAVLLLDMPSFILPPLLGGGVVTGPGGVGQAAAADSCQTRR